MQNDIVSKARLHFNEHFILRRFTVYIPHYVILWVACIVCALVLSSLPFQQPVTDYTGLRTFTSSFTMIITLTITIAVPTCLLAMVSAYADYYSTKIREILIQRFPITLLMMSAFTTLLIFISVISGVIGTSIPVDFSAMFYVVLFWLLVCVFYLFLAIEKMGYFVFNAPYAVLDKLEYGVFSENDITTQEEYDKFRSELASMNDIAATILARSTGQDEAVTKILSTFGNIHHHYLSTADKSRKKQFRYHMSACQAVDHEIVRIFRTACNEKNELSVKNVMNVYCDMIADAITINTNTGYFNDMIDELSRMQSYAASSFVDELKYSSYINWFFLIAKKVGTTECTTSKYSTMARALSMMLRKATMEDDQELITRFMKVAANTNPSCDIKELAPAWRTVLDRAVFVYATWLVDTEPDDAKRYLYILNKYTFVDMEIYTPVMPATINRIKGLLTYENIASLTGITDPDATQPGFATDQTALAMAMNLNNTSAHTFLILSLMSIAGMSVNELRESGKAGNAVANELPLLKEQMSDAETASRADTASAFYPGLIAKIDEVAQEAERDE